MPDETAKELRALYALPPDLFTALFLVREEKRAVKELRRLRREIQQDGLLRGLLRGPGRPKGSQSPRLALEGIRLAIAVDWYGLSKAAAMRKVGRPTTYPKWLDRRLERGRRFLAEEERESPSLAAWRDRAKALTRARRGSEAREQRNEEVRKLLEPLRTSGVVKQLRGKR